MPPCTVCSATSLCTWREQQTGMFTGMLDFFPSQMIYHNEPFLKNKYVLYLTVQHPIEREQGKMHFTL